MPSPVVAIQVAPSPSSIFTAQKTPYCPTMVYQPAQIQHGPYHPFPNGSKIGPHAMAAPVAPPFFSTLATSSANNGTAVQAIQPSSTTASWAASTPALHLSMDAHPPP